MKLASPISQTSWKGGKRLHENCFQVGQCAGKSLNLLCVGRVVAEGRAGQADGPQRAALDKISRPLYTSVCFLYGFGPCE